MGDFWETQERRGIAAFTTALAVDKFILVTSSLTNTQPPMLVFPASFNPSRQADRRLRALLQSALDQNRTQKKTYPTRAREDTGSGEDRARIS